MGYNQYQKKTVCMVISKRECNWSELRIRSTILKQNQKSNYLRSLITQNEKCDEEIKRRLAMARDSFIKLERILIGNVD